MLSDDDVRTAAAGVAAVAAVCAAGGVGVAARALRFTRKQAVTTFEDSLDREYREIVRTLPAEVFFRDRANAPLNREQKQAMMRYFDLSNEQLRMIRDGRIEASTGVSWEEGIRDVMELKDLQDRVEGRPAGPAAELLDLSLRQVEALEQRLGAVPGPTRITAGARYCNRTRGTTPHAPRLSRWTGRPDTVLCRGPPQNQSVPVSEHPAQASPSGS